MGRITIIFADTLNTTSALKLRWAEAATPTAYIGSQDYPASTSGHPQRTLTIEGISDKMHNVEIWRSSDGVTYETHQLTLQVDASLSSSSHTVYEYEVGSGLSGPGWADPVEGDTEMTDDRLKDCAWYIEQRGIGKLKDVEYDTDPATGTWTLLLTQMIHGETYFAVVEKNVTAANTGGGGGTQNFSGEFYDVVPVAGDVTFSVATHGGKMLEVTSAQQVVTITIPLVSTLSKCKVLIQTHSMTGRYCWVKFQTADMFGFLGKPTTGAIYLGRGEELQLLFAGGKTYVQRYEGDYRRVGQLLHSRNLVDTLNTLRLDGSEYNVADYPRIKWYMDRLAAGQVLTRAQWEAGMLINDQMEYPGKGFFMLDGARFRVPDLRDRYIKFLTLNDTTDRIAVDGSPGSDAVAGNLMWDALYEHQHGVAIALDNINVAAFGFKTLPSNKFMDDPTSGRTINRVPLTETVGEKKAQVRNIGFVPEMII